MASPFNTAPVTGSCQAYDALASSTHSKLDRCRPQSRERFTSHPSSLFTITRRYGIAVGHGVTIRAYAFVDEKLHWDTGGVVRSSATGFASGEVLIRLYATGNTSQPDSASPQLGC